MSLSVIRVLLALSLPSAWAACERAYFAPYFNLGYAAYRESGQPPKGYVIDMLHSLAERSGCKIDLRELPTERVRRTVASIPIVAPATANSNLLARGWIFVPMWKDYSRLIVRKDLNVKNLAEISQRNDVIVGVLHGGRYGAWVERLLVSMPSKRMDMSSNLDDLFRKMAVSRVGATFASEDVYRWHLDRLPQPLVVDSYEVPEQAGAAIGVMLNPKVISPADLEQFTQTLIKLREDGSFSAMMSRYLGPESAKHFQWSEPRRAKSSRLP